MRKFQKLMLSHRCVCMCADLHPHAYEQQLKSDLHPHAYQQQLKWTRKQKKPHGLRKDTIGWTHGCRQTREWWRHCVRESIGISLGGCLCVWVCLFACAGACVLIWVVQSEIHAATVLTPFWPDSAMSLGALAVVLRGRRATLRAWLLYPAHLPCNAHATHMQHTCNTHATHMQHDMQHELFTCKFTVNVQDLTFVAPTPVLEWKV